MVSSAEVMGIPAMDRLAVYGWSDSTPALLNALAEHASLRAVAIGDERPSALVHARSVTGLPCFQHPHEMVRASMADAILIAGGAGAASVAEAAAHRGLDVLLMGAEADAETLERASSAAARHGVAFAVVRPRLRSAGHPFVTAQLATGGAIDSLLLDIVERDPAWPVLRDAVAFWARLLGRPPVDVAASCAGSLEAPSALAVQLRLAGGGFASITVRTADSSRLRLAASGPKGVAELDVVEGVSTLVLARDGRTETFIPAAADPLLTEARRISEVRGGSDLDVLLAPREAAVLAAVERALEGAFALHLGAPARPALRVLPGGGHPVAPGSANAPRRLTLVSR